MCTRTKHRALRLTRVVVVSGGTPVRCLRKGVATDLLLGVCVVVHHGLHEHHHDHEEVTEGGLGGQKSIFQESTESGPYTYVYGHRTITDGVGRLV